MKVSASRRWFLKALGLTPAAHAVTVRKRARQVAARAVPAFELSYMMGPWLIVADRYCPQGTAYMIDTRAIVAPGYNAIITGLTE